MKRFFRIYSPLNLRFHSFWLNKIPEAKLSYIASQEKLTRRWQNRTLQVKNVKSGWNSGRFRSDKLSSGVGQEAEVWLVLKCDWDQVVVEVEVVAVVEVVVDWDQDGARPRVPGHTPTCLLKPRKEFQQIFLARAISSLQLLKIPLKTHLLPTNLTKSGYIQVLRWISNGNFPAPKAWFS